MPPPNDRKKTATVPKTKKPAAKPPKQPGSQGSRAEGSCHYQETEILANTFAAPTITPPEKHPRQAGSEGSRAGGSRNPQEAENSGEDFDLPISDHDEGFDDLLSHSRTQETSKTHKAADIKRFFKVSKELQKRVCTLCGYVVVNLWRSFIQLNLINPQ